VLYLWTYPYECAEQISSRLLGILALRDVLQAFAVKTLPAPEVVQSKLTRDIASLQGKQHYNGGFGWWNGYRSDIPNPFVSVHASSCIAMCLEKKVPVADTMTNKAKQYLVAIDERIAEYERHNHYAMDIKSKNGIKAYSLYVRTKFGENVATLAAALYRGAGTEEARFTFEALGWLLVALSKNQVASVNGEVEKIKKYLFARVNETAETANFITSYGDDGQSVMLHSNRRTDAAVLEGLLYSEPTAPLNVKLAKGLLAAKVKGCWSSTQENCFILIALDKFFHVFEKDVPDFIAR
jgi:uncharacterized protein YfaS (alpha-2-macroglobulin family)